VVDSWRQHIQDFHLWSGGEQVGVAELVLEASVERLAKDVLPRGSRLKVAVHVPLNAHELRRAWALKSGPLSDRINDGSGSGLVGTSNSATTFLDLQCLPIRMARQRRQCLSMSMRTDC